jgi:Ulp1 family protease
VRDRIRIVFVAVSELTIILQVIMRYLKLLQKRDNHLCSLDSERRPILIFDSMFFEKLCFVKSSGERVYNYDYSKVDRWTRSHDIFSLDKVVVPINIDNIHWALVVIYPQSKEIHFFDSFQSEKDQNALW